QAEDAGALEILDVDRLRERDEQALRDVADQRQVALDQEVPQVRVARLLVGPPEFVDLRTLGDAPLRLPLLLPRHDRDRPAGRSLPHEKRSSGGGGRTDRGAGAPRGRVERAPKPVRQLAAIPRCASRSWELRGSGPVALRPFLSESLP